jgi:hypothetical protein
LDLFHPVHPEVLVDPVVQVVQQDKVSQRIQYPVDRIHSVSVAGEGNTLVQVFERIHLLAVSTVLERIHLLALHFHHHS